MKQKKKNTTIWLIVLIVFAFFLAAVVLLASVSGLSPVFGEKNIGVVPIKGEIVLETSSGLFQDETMAGAYNVIEALDEAEKDKKVSVIFLDINSPGGSPVASKEIADRVRNLSKPCVAWIGEIGASGGYYVAASADQVVAHPSSLTGSIGAYMMLTHFYGLLERINVSVDLLVSGEHKDMGSPYRNTTAEEEQILQDMVQSIYADFKNDVLEYRKGRLNETSFDTVSDGRIILGKDALRLGLIDKTGTKKEALRLAAELGNISGEPKITYFGEKPMSLFDLASFLGKSLGTGFAQALTTRLTQQAQATPQLR